MCSLRNLPALFPVVLLALIRPALFGQTALTLDQAIEVAVKNNNALAMARLEVTKAQNQVREAWGYALPTVSLDAEYVRALKRPVFFLSDLNDPSSGKVTPIKIGSDNSVQLGVTASQVLFNAIVFTGMSTAAVYEQAAHENYRAAYNRTVADAKRSYYGVLLARQVLETTRASLQNAEDNLTNVQILNRQGIVSDYDLLRAQVQVENGRPTVIEAEKNVLVAQNNLKIALGLEADRDVTASDALRFTPVDSSWITQSVVGTNASLKALSCQRSLSDKLIAIRRSEYLPTLSAFGNYQWQAQKNTFGFGRSDFVASSQVGVSLSVNLFNGFQTTSRIGQARVERRQAEEQIAQLRETLRTQFQTIRLRLDEAQKRIRSQERTVVLAEKTYTIATTRYTTGSGTQLEVNDADVALLRARLNQVHAVYDYAIARTDLEEILSMYDPP